MHTSKTIPALPAQAMTESATVLEDLREIVHDFVMSRELLSALTLRDLRVRYKQSMIGVAWALLTPLVILLSGLLVRWAFASIAGQPIDGKLIAGIAVKSIAWAFFVGALSFGTSSLTQNLTLVTKVYFPRELLPMAAIATQMVDSAIGGLLLAVILPLLGIAPSASLLWVPLLAVTLILLTTALTLLLACANVFFRDARHLVQVIMSFGIFFTPVFFDAAALGPRGAQLVMVNPLAPVLEGLRLAIVEGHNLARPLFDASGGTIWNPFALWYAVALSVVGVVASALVFHRAEFKFAEYV